MIEFDMPSRDYYEILGISRTASSDEIRQAFRKLARKYHPDSTTEGNKIAAEEKFKEVNEAYSTLSSPDKRTRYDRFGNSSSETATPQSSPTRKEGGNTTKPKTEVDFGGQFGGLDIDSLFGKGDIFSSMFGFGQKPIGKDEQGWFFAIPQEDIKLLSAMYKLRVEASEGKRGMVYDTEVYRVSLQPNDECRVQVRPNHWRTAQGEIRTSKYGQYEVIDSNKPIDIDKVGYSWTNIERPPSVSYYLQMVDSLSRKLTMPGTVNVEREHKVICDYGYDGRIIDRFDTRRVGYDEVHKIVENYSAKFRDVRVETGGEKTRR